LKIAHLTSVHPRYDTRIVNMCRSLARHNYEAHLIVADGNGDENIHGIEIHDIGAEHGAVLYRMPIRVFRVFKKAKTLNADVYHFHDPELMFAGILLKMFRFNVVFDVHEDLPRQIMRKYYIPAFIRKLVSFASKIAEWLTANIVDAVVTVTPHLVEKFKYANVYEIRNYPVLSEFEKVEVHKSKITYVGAISRTRGIMQMTESFARGEHRLTLVGRFQPASLQQEAECLDGWSQVDYLGWQSREQVSSLLASSSIGLVLLQPTGDYEDAFPVKLFEYMAAGVAVIASDFPLWRSIIESENVGVCVNPNDTQAISGAIEELLNDPERIKLMGRNGVSATVNRYNWETQERVLFKLYDDIVG
jgi:glycosyltransferase involved in cell wall biosynthesis